MPLPYNARWGSWSRLIFQPVVVLFGNVTKSVETKLIDSSQGKIPCALKVPGWRIPICCSVSVPQIHHHGFSINAEAEGDNYA